MKKYSFKTGGYYDVAIHGISIPADAVSITADEYKALLDGQATGKAIIKGSGGRPILSEGLPPTIDQLSAIARSKRDECLRKSDFSQLPDSPVNKSEWAAYRQALRDVPGQSSFPQSVTWPVAPKD